MNVFEFYRGLEKSNPLIKEIAIQAVQDMEAEVIADSIDANLSGLTFLGNSISDVKPFTDWNDSGQFHSNLKFLNDSNIEFTSQGEGAEAVFDSFDLKDTIAPHAKTLSDNTKKKITESLKIKLLEKITNNK